MTTDGVRLGDLLTGAGLLQASDLREAMLISKQQGLPVGRVLIMSGYLTEQNLQAAVQAQSLLKDGLIEFELVIKALTMVGAEDITLEEAFKRLKWNQQTDAVTNKLGELLLAAEVVEMDALNAALLQCQAIGLPLGRVLIASGALTEQMLAATLNAQVFIRDKKLTRDQAIQGLKSAKERQIPIEQYLAESGAMQLPTAETVRLGELFVASGIIDEPNVMGAVEVGLLNEQPLGQVLLNSNAITQEVLDAALDLQAMVGAGAIKKDEAAKYLGIVKTKKVTVGEAIALGQKKPSKKQQAAPIEDLKIAIEPLPFYQFLQLSGIITAKQIEEAIRIGSKDTQIMSKMLALSGIMEQPFIEAAQKCNDLISSGVLNHEQGMIALKSCERNNYSLENAFNELGWNTSPLRANPDVPEALMDFPVSPGRAESNTEITKPFERSEMMAEASSGPSTSAAEQTATATSEAAPATTQPSPAALNPASVTMTLPAAEPRASAESLSIPPEFATNPEVAALAEAIASAQNAASAQPGTASPISAAESVASADAAASAELAHLFTEPPATTGVDTSDTLTPVSPGELAPGPGSVWGAGNDGAPLAGNAAVEPVLQGGSPKQPAAAQGNPFESQSNPLESAAQASPFEAPAAAPAQSNPFEAPAPALAQANPFEAAAAAPMHADPFEAPAPAPLPAQANPFEAPAAASAAANPFGQAQSATDAPASSWGMPEQQQAVNPAQAPNFGQAAAPSAFAAPPSAPAQAPAPEPSMPSSAGLFSAAMNPFDEPEAAPAAAPQPSMPFSAPAPAAATPAPAAQASSEPAALAELGAALSAVSFGEPAVAEPPQSAPAANLTSSVENLDPFRASGDSFPAAPSAAPAAAQASDDGWKLVSPEPEAATGPATDTWQNGGQAQTSDAWAGGQAQQQAADSPWGAPPGVSQAPATSVPGAPAAQAPATPTPAAQTPAAQAPAQSAFAAPPQAPAAAQQPASDWAGQSFTNAPTAAGGDWTSPPNIGTDADWGPVPTADWGTSSAPTTPQTDWSTGAPAAGPQPSPTASNPNLAAAEWQPPIPAAQQEAQWQSPAQAAPQQEWQPPQQQQQSAPQPPAQPAQGGQPNFGAGAPSPLPGWQSSSAANLDAWQQPAAAAPAPSAAQMFQEAAQSLAGDGSAPNTLPAQPAPQSQQPAAEQTSQIDLFANEEDDHSDPSDKPKKRLSDLMPKFGPKI